MAPDEPRRTSPKVSEAAFLLWVLAALMMIWVVIGLVLHFT
jgi:hypothetical protein